MNRADKYISWKDAHDILNKNSSHIFNQHVSFVSTRVAFGVSHISVIHGEGSQNVIRKKDNEYLSIFEERGVEYIQFKDENGKEIYLTARAPMVYPEDKYSDPRYDD